MKNKIQLEVKNAEAVIDAWLLKLAHNTIFQTDIAMYNKLHALKEELKRDLGITKETPVVSTIGETLTEESK